MNESYAFREKGICLIVGGDLSRMGGLEKHFIEICNGLSDKFRVSVVAHSDYRAYLSEKIIFHPLDLSKSRFNLINMFFLWTLLRKKKFHIVHSQASKATKIISFLRHFLSFKMVATLHNIKKDLSGFERADRVICVSNKLLEHFKNVDTRVVYNGIEPPDVSASETFFVDNFDIPLGAFVVVSVGRLVPAKGFDVLLEAFQGIDARLIIVGDGPEEDNLKKQSQILGLEGKVVFSGWRKDVQEIIVNADLVVISSRREGFSYVMAETLLNRRLLVTTDVADVGLVVGAKYTVNVEACNDLKNKIKYVIDNREEVTNDFQRTFDFAQREFTIESMVDKTADLYVDLLS